MTESRSNVEGPHPVRAGEEPLPPSSSQSAVRMALQILLLLLGVAALLWILYRLRGILLLLVLAVFFAYLVAPLVEKLRRPVMVRGRKFVLPRPAAIGAVYVLVFGSIAAACVLLLPVLDDQLGQLAREAPGYVTRVQALWQSWQTGYQSHALPQELRDAIDRATRQAVTAGGTYVTNELLPRLAGWLVYLPWLILVPILAFFLLKDAEPLRKSALRILPRGHLRSRGDVFLVELNDTLAAYIRAQVTACLLVGLVCTIGFLVIGVPYAVVLGITAGLLEFIPMAGPLTTESWQRASPHFTRSGRLWPSCFFSWFSGPCRIMSCTRRSSGRVFICILSASCWLSCAARSSVAWQESSSRFLPLQ